MAVVGVRARTDVTFTAGTVETESQLEPAMILPSLVVPSTVTLYCTARSAPENYVAALGSSHACKRKSCKPDVDTPGRKRSCPTWAENARGVSVELPVRDSAVTIGQVGHPSGRAMNLYCSETAKKLLCSADVAVGSPHACPLQVCKVPCLIPRSPLQACLGDRVWCRCRTGCRSAKTCRRHCRRPAAGRCARNRASQAHGQRQRGCAEGEPVAARGPHIVLDHACECKRRVHGRYNWPCLDCSTASAPLRRPGCKGLFP